MRAEALRNKTLSPKESEMYKDGAMLNDDGMNELPLVHAKHLVLAYHVARDGTVDQ